MKNKFFPNEDLTYNDLYFVCYMIERTARKLHRRNRYVVGNIGKEELYVQLSTAQVNHCLNPDEVVHTWIKQYNLTPGDFNIFDVDKTYATVIPTPTQMGKVYARLIYASITDNQDWTDVITDVYSSPICNTIDNYNSSAFYEPSYIQLRAYREGVFA